MKSNKMKNMKKRIVALLLCMAMVMNGGISAVASDVAASGGTTEPQAASLDDVHVHTEACYTKSKVSENPICGKEVIEGHVHGDTCYKASDPELTCTLNETEGHTHGERCTETVEVVTCTTQEHSHGDGCYTTEKKLSCGQEETEEHAHGESCYTEEEIFTCTKAEHIHGEGCSTTETRRICTLAEEAAHTHGEDCYTTTETLICELEEVEVHSHGDDCYEWSEELTCKITVPELTKVKETCKCGNENCACTTCEDGCTCGTVEKNPTICKVCQKDPCDCADSTEDNIVEQKIEEPEEITITNENVADIDITVSVESTSDVLPEGTKVKVAPMEESEEITTALGTFAGELNVLGYMAYDISLKDAENTEVSLNGNNVNVAINFENKIPEGIDAADATEVVLVHITADEDDNAVAERMGTVETTENKEAVAVDFETASFSPYVVVWLSKVDEEIVEEPKEYKFSNDELTITVTPTAETDGLANVSTVSVAKLTEEHSQYEQIKELIVNKALGAGKSDLGFYAYDVSFFDAEEREVSLNEEVNISVEYTIGIIPEEANVANVSAVNVEVMDLDITNGLPELTGAAATLKENTYAVGNVTYTTNNFDGFILAWSGDKYITLSESVEDGMTITLEGTEYALQSANYFEVTPITETTTNDQYDKVVNKLKEDTTIIDFLAYDITLFNKVEEGNKIEVTPAGPIKVTIAYDTPVSSTAVGDQVIKGVTVMHLEEGANDEITSVVDLSNTENKPNITRDKNAVKNVEFTTNSFSTFVLSWIKAEELVAIIVDLENNEIGERKVIIPPGDFNIRNIEQTITHEGKTYMFDRAYLADLNGNNKIDNIQYLRYEGGWQYNISGQTYKDVGTQTLYFCYGLPVNKLTTANSVADGIVIDLFNYDKDINKPNRPFKFVGMHGSSANSVAPSKDGFQQGLVKNSLDGDGYPILNWNTNTSLSYLFDDQAAGVTAYKNLDGLFQKDADGYYYYSSKENHAQLNVAEQRIDVYDAKLYPSTSAITSGILPFNSLPEGALSGKSYYLRSNTDYWFGLNVTASFAQPEDGLVNGKAMTFEFEGDDDMWVFLDGNLVLDIGGMHGWISGSINFANGEVKVNSPNGKHANTKNPKYQDGKTPTTYIGEQFKAAGVTEETLEALFNKNTDGKYTSFKDNTKHTMKVFYFERGCSLANCTMSFNLPTIPAGLLGSAIVEKQVDNFDETVNFEEEFKFQANIGDTLVEQAPMGGASFSRIDRSGATTTGITDANGYFYLKAGEKAKFDNLTAGKYFSAKEVEISAGQCNKVEVSNKVVEIQGDGQTVASTAIPISSINTETITFKNYPAGQLEVTKNWETTEDVSTTSVYVGLYRKGENNTATATTRYGTLSAKNNWKATFEKLLTPEKYKVKELREVETGESKEAEYTINGKGYIGVEAGEGIVINGKYYQVTYEGNTITNTLRKMSLKIVKVNPDNERLADVEFELKDSEGNIIGNATKTTDANGEIIFDDLQQGTYTLTEVKARPGYSLCEPINITLPYDSTIEDSSVTVNEQIKVGEKLVCYSITKTVVNKMLYELPATGGIGTFGHTVGGVVLMMGTALMAYKKKREEVLGSR